MCERKSKWMSKRTHNGRRKNWTMKWFEERKKKTRHINHHRSSSSSWRCSFWFFLHTTQYPVRCRHLVHTYTFIEFVLKFDESYIMGARVRHQHFHSICSLNQVHFFLYPHSWLIKVWFFCWAIVSVIKLAYDGIHFSFLPAMNGKRWQKKN